MSTPQFLTPRQKQQQILDTEKFLETLRATPAVTHCQACLNFQNGEWCDVFNSKPPVEFYDKDCEAFADDIPWWSIMNLYELANEYQQALDFLTDPANDIDDQTIADTIESLDGDIDDKILNVARFIVSIEHQADGIAEIQKRQQQRKKSLENKADWLRNYIQVNLNKTAKTKVTSPDIAVSLAKLPASVKVIDEAQIPADFWREKIERSVDKTAIKQAGGCPGAEIVSDGFRVAIKWLNSKNINSRNAQYR